MHNNVFAYAGGEIRKAILNAYERACESGALPKVELPPFDINEPRDKSHGDFAANFAMIWAKPLGKNPRLVAETIVGLVECKDYLAECSVAGPGFVNFKLSPAYLAEALDTIVHMGGDYGKTDLLQGKKIIVEFVSANPTGPMHLGNARGGVLGDALASVLESCGASVTREFYVNDTGNQMDLLGRSMESRYFTLYGDEESYPFPEDGYHGEDILENAKKFAALHGDKYLKATEEERRIALRAFGLEENLGKIKRDLSAYGIEYDQFFHESSLYADGQVEELLGDLEKAGHLYDKEGGLWFEATKFGCEKDDCLRKQNGFYTYYTADIAYHKNKLVKRGFDTAIDVFGADHHGHTVRFRAAMEALGLDSSRLQFVLMQLVRLLQDGEVVRMSKRSGKSITLSDLLEEVPVDAARFFFCNRQADSQMDFDMSLAVKEDSDNPVYYVQYAHARICSVIQNAAAESMTVPEEPEYHLLQAKEEEALIKLLARFPEENVQAAKSYDPSKITRYVLDVAAHFHTFYNACRVRSEDKALTGARLALCVATRQVIRNAMGMLKVSCPDKM